MPASRMFKTITRTWNPVVGCYHDCVYCWARRLAEAKLKDTPRYKDGFVPKLIEKELDARFKSDEFVFVSDMGDLLGDWVDSSWIHQVLDTIAKWPETTFLLQTKNPSRFLDFVLPPNVYAGATIETDVWYPDISKAPQPFSRYRAMSKLPSDTRKFVSIEPIMDFALGSFLDWITNIKPDIIEVGADNYRHNLPEPPWWKVERLLEGLRQVCPDVKEKVGLERLRK